MSSNVPRSKSAPTTKPLSAHFLPKNVSFSTLEAPSRPPANLQRSATDELSIFDSQEQLYRSSIDSPLSQRVEAFNLSGGFFPAQAHEYEWVSSSTGSSPLVSGISGQDAALDAQTSPGLSPTSAFSSLPATPGASIVHRPLPDELDHMATQAIQSEDKMGVLKITARSLSTYILSSGKDKEQTELSTDTEPVTDEALYAALRARRETATTPLHEQATYGELFLGPDSDQVESHSEGWNKYLARLF